MNTRKVKKIFLAKPTLEGAGVHLHRGFGFYEIPQFDPFLLFDDFSGSQTADYIAGFPWHPHRGIETVTYMFAGVVEHQDSMGNVGAIGPGAVQWMTAGSGIVHQEMPKESPEGIAGFQLWVNLPAQHKMISPRYRDIHPSDIPLVEKDGMQVRVIAGVCEGIEGPVRDLVVRTTYLDIALTAGKTFTQEFPSNDTVFAYIYSGSVIGENDAYILAGNIVLMERGDHVSITAGDTGARLLLIAGKPIGEKIAWHGPIVMNTNDELVQAFTEYENGTFIKNTRA